MKELMLTLLTYEPFQKFTKCYSDEKKYIDAILNGETSFPDCNKYHKLFTGFKKYNDQWNKNIAFKPSDLKWLKDWKQDYYSSSDYMTKGSRELYPILFKKICFFIIIKENRPDKDILDAIGLRVNILNKWKVSARYRKISLRDTYVPLPLHRNGIKKNYIVKVVKKLYFEANRQCQEGNAASKENMPKKTVKNQPYKFVDVFAGTGSVAAAMNLPGKQLLLNDADIGVACYLYSISNNASKFMDRFIVLIKDFTKENSSTENEHIKEMYRNEWWRYHEKQQRIENEHQRTNQIIADPDPSVNLRGVDMNIGTIRIEKDYSQCPVEDEDSVVIMRQNYNSMLDDLKSAPSFKNLKEKKIFELGAEWFFCNSVKEPAYTANSRDPVTKITVESYEAFLKSIGIGSRFELNINRSNVKNVITAYMKRMNNQLRGAEITCEDFRKVIESNPAEFLYLDSPYFLTPGYDVSFGDKDHKDMLDLLRDSSSKWVFSMQRYGFDTKSGKTKRLGIRIKNYGDYYRGFANKFIDPEEGEKFYRIDETLSSKADSLYMVLLSTREMLICNFDIRRAIPYNQNSLPCIMPYRDFMEFMQNNKGTETLENRALEWRRKEIQDNYASGDIV